MPSDDAIKFGVLKCRDLVQLYYGARMVSLLESLLANFTANTLNQILLSSPSRIGYEISMANLDAAAQNCIITQDNDPELNQGSQYSIPPGDTRIITRSFLTDLDSVTWGVLIQPSSANIVISTREVILSPLPADES